MDFLTISDSNFLIFIIPGFLTVWAFRYFTKSKKQGDFELLGLSFVWGLILLVSTELLMKFLYRNGYDDKIHLLLVNPYVTAISLSFLGLIMGWFGSHISQDNSFKKLIKYISPKINNDQK